MTPNRLTLDVVRNDIASILDTDPSDIPEGSNLVDLGLDSIRIMVLVQRWKEATGKPVEFASLAEEPELGAWWRYLSGGDR